MKLINTAEQANVSGGNAIIGSDFIIVSNHDKVTFDKDDFAITPQGLCLNGELDSSVFTNPKEIVLTHHYAKLGGHQFKFSGFKLSDNIALYFY